MKLLQAQRDALLRPLQAVSGIVERRHTLPILSNILLQLADGQLRLTATDLEIQVTAESEMEKAGEGGAVTLSARKLQDILRALPEDSNVVLDAQANRVQVKSGKSRFNLQTLPAEDFPRMAESDSGVTTLTVPEGELKRLLALVQYAMAQQDIRYYLNGLLLVVSGTEMKVVATDGHRLAFTSLAIGAASGAAEVILPRKAVLELVKLLGDGDAPVTMEIAANQVRFRFGGVRLVTKVVDGKFPDYTRVIPTNYTKSITVDRALLYQSLQRAAILSNEKFRGVRWMLTSNSLRISCTNNEQEEAQEELEVDYTSDALDIGFNVNYLLDVLTNVDGPTVTCSFGDSSSSVLMTVTDKSAFKYVIMPMRI